MDAALAQDLAISAGPAPFWATWLVRALGVYFAAGVAFAVAFHLRGMVRVDPNAGASSWGFRVLVTPGVIALWPVLARAWLRGAPIRERNAHRDATGSA